jgi:hypothetical protein
VAGGARFDHLLSARERTRVELDRRRVALEDVAFDPGVALVLVGSWGRHELTEGSDDDFMLLVRGTPREPVRPTLDVIARVLGGGARKPGAEEIFGQVVFSADLAGHIGLQRDDNRNLTRRMLLMLESLAVRGEEPFASARAEVLAGYLDASVRDYRPPRFLLNDLVRYWRTICVDFVGKERERQGRGWALRAVKLETSRKLLFAGGLLPVLACHALPAREMGGFLLEQLDRSPTDRLAHAFLEAGAVDPGVRALSAYDAFISLLDDTAARDELAGLTPAEAPRSEVFAEAKRIGRDLEGGLLALLFETEPLRRLIREFGIF